MSRARAWQALWVSAFVTLGCSANIEGDAPGIPGGGAGTSGIAGGPSTGTHGRDAVAQRCAATQLAPPQLRRLTAKELERTLRDVFPSLGSAWSGVQLGRIRCRRSDFRTTPAPWSSPRKPSKSCSAPPKTWLMLLTTGSALAQVVPCASEAAAGARLRRPAGSEGGRAPVSSPAFDRRGWRVRRAVRFGVGQERLCDGGALGARRAHAVAARGVPRGARCGFRLRRAPAGRLRAGERAFVHLWR